jgi:hypothetical protein
MALHLAFEKDADSMIKRVVRAFAGPYVHTDMIISQIAPAPIHTAYSSYMGEGFMRVFQHEFCFSAKTHDFLFLDVTPEEIRKISETCEACAESKIGYNTRDMVLCIVPLRQPKEKDLFQAGSLFCSQAMILILRSCLNPEHPLQAVLQNVHSRTTTPSQLFTALQSACHVTIKPVFSS